MDTKKMRWVSGNSVIEMSYIMPLFFSLFVIIIHTVFYYHDKAIIGGAAAESDVMGAQYFRRYSQGTPGMRYLYWSQDVMSSGRKRP